MKYTELNFNNTPVAFVILYYIVQIQAIINLLRN